MQDIKKTYRELLCEIKSYCGETALLGQDIFVQEGAFPTGELKNASPPSVDAPPVEKVAGDPKTRMEAFHDEIADCQKCKLAQGRTKLVFGVGNPAADLVFVGEAPGREEDLSGEVFVGKAGQLLTKIISAMGLSRDDVYICNVLKCRPPQNRDPQPDEVATCEPHLLKQLDIIRPRVIVGLGKFACATLLGRNVAITRMRGEWHEYNGIPLMLTYHPSYLLRTPSGKKDVWEDMKLVMTKLGLSSSHYSGS
jgi:uracil-DNA glycosylase